MNFDIDRLIIDAENRAKQRGVSFTAVLERANVNASTWRRWRAGAHSPQLSKLSAIMDAVEQVQAQPKRARKKITR